MMYLIFLGGVFAGAIGAYIVFWKTSAHGYFMTVPYEDEDTNINEGFYSVKVSLPKDMKLVNKGRIILHKSGSHK